MSTLPTYIQQLMTEGGDQNFLIIDLNAGAYIQLASENGSQKIYIEVSGFNSKTNFELSSKQIEEMSQLDWKVVSSPYHNNYGRDVIISTAQDIELLEHLIHKTASVFETPLSAYTYTLNLQ